MTLTPHVGWGKSLRCGRSDDQTSKSDLLISPQSDFNKSFSSSQMSILEAWGPTYLRFVTDVDKKIYCFFQHPRRHIQYVARRCKWHIPLPWLLWWRHLGFLDVFLVFHGWVPFVEIPTPKYAFHQRCVWTVIVLGIFLLLQETPIYGIERSDMGLEIMMQSVLHMSPGSVLYSTPQIKLIAVDAAGLVAFGGH
jgi:hypothetical protein